MQIPTSIDDRTAYSLSAVKSMVDMDKLDVCAGTIQFAVKHLIMFCLRSRAAVFLGI